MNALIIVAALGYFVDVYDLILFSVVRIDSLKSLGLSQQALMTEGVYLLNMQMFGMLVGGLLWGIWGDKFGRISVLFGSILMYSAANIANGFVYTVPSYALCRLIAGIGLAGELGAGITLVAETMPKEKRGIGTTIVATVGVMGAVVAAVTGKYFDWRTSYFIGGGMGLALLFLRIAVHESGLFQNVKSSDVSRGSLPLLFSSPRRIGRYLCCILSGVPLWFVIGVLITFSPEIGQALGVSEVPVSGTAVFYSYIGLTLGDMASGLLSQYLKSRKKVLLIFLSFTALFCAVYLNSYGADIRYFYLLCFALGVAAGYWAMFVTVAAEQFGTNLRATVATSVPNFVRGATVALTLLFDYLTPHTGIIKSAGIVALLSISLAYAAIFSLEESFHKDMDYLEH